MHVTSRNALAALAAGLVAAALLSGCGSTSDSMDGGTAEVAASAEMPMMDQAVPDSAAMPMAEDLSRASAVDRSVIRTAYLTMRVDVVDDAVTQVRDLVTRSNGIIASESIATGSPGGYASITAQIPADGLQAFLDEAAALGDVDSLDVSAQDVTTQVIDLDARIAVLRSSIDRLTALLDDATRVEDIIAIESELARRQADLDSLTSQQTYLAEQVAMSTVTISLTPMTTVADVDTPGFLSGLQTGWSALIALAGIAITALGFLLPFAVIAAIVVVPLTILLVRRSRRRRTRSQQAAPSPEPADSTAPVQP